MKTRTKIALVVVLVVGLFGGISVFQSVQREEKAAADRKLFAEEVAYYTELAKTLKVTITAPGFEWGDPDIILGVDCPQIILWYNEEAYKMIFRSMTAEEIRLYPMKRLEREGLRDAVRWYLDKYPMEPIDLGVDESKLSIFFAQIQWNRQGYWWSPST